MRQIILFSLVFFGCACILTGVPFNLTATPSRPGQTFTVTSPSIPTQTRASTPTTSTRQSTNTVQTTITYVPGSTQKVCLLTGETDHETNQPTASQTVSRFGLLSSDLGYSFEHDGKLFFLFGDSKPANTFDGKPNLGKDPPRIADDNDAIAYTTDTASPCIRLNFITDAIGAYKNPAVLNAQGKPAITLRVDEIPVAGISDAGKMYVIFATDNYMYQTTGPSKTELGMATRTVIGVSDDDGSTFHYLYDLSKGPDARFINVAIAQASDGYLYFWGTQGGAFYRKSPVYLARKPMGSMSSLNGIEYLHAVNPDGTPVFMPDESDAEPLFHDTISGSGGALQAADCMGELGVAWNAFLKRWIMLYNCLNDTTTNPRGIYMRYAAQPWGPWSPPQTIFNLNRDVALCHYVHRAVNAQFPNPCDNLSDPGRLDVSGGGYGPYFLARFTTNNAANGTSTFYYTLSTWNPYGQVIVKSTVRGEP